MDLLQAILRKSFPLIVLMALCAFAYVAVLGPNGVAALGEKRRQIRELQDNNAGLAAENEKKRERIKRLKEHPGELELEIREKWKVGKPGETQLILPDASENQPESSEKK